MGEKRIAIEFDGTIVQPRTFPTIGPLQPNVKEVISELRKLGYYIIIHSTRNNITLYGNEEKKLLFEMRDFIESNGIEYDELDDGSKGKPIADIYLSHRNEKHTDWMNFFHKVVYNREYKKTNRNEKVHQDDDWVNGATEI